MRAILLSVQYASIAALFLESWILFKRLKNSPLSYLFLSCLMILTNNIGYLFQLLSATQEAYTAALIFSYVGRAWITFFLFLFTIELCKIKFPSVLRIILPIMHITISLFILTLTQHKFYYTWTKFTTDGIFPRLIHGNGIVHDFFMTLQSLYMIVGFTWLFSAFFKEKNRATKHRLMAVIVSFLIQAFFYIANTFKFFAITNSYDVTMIGYVIGAAVMFVAFFRYDLLGTKEIARDFIIDRLSEGIIAVDTSGSVQYCNARAKEVFPNTESDSQKTIQQMQASAQNGSSISVNGRIYTVEENDLTRGDKKVGKLYVLIDATEHYERFKKEKNILQRELRIDPLTGLYNRAGMEYFSERVYKEALQNNKPLFVCICDMNGLKYINDNFGHEEGDNAIKKLSQIIKESAGKDDMAFRIGGDEFLILGIKDDEQGAASDFRANAEKAITVFNQTLGLPYKVDMSYGPLAQKLTGRPNEFSDMLKASDALMYEMKKQRDEHKR